MKNLNFSKKGSNKKLGLVLSLAVVLVISAFFVFKKDNRQIEISEKSEFVPKIKQLANEQKVVNVKDGGELKIEENGPYSSRYSFATRVCFLRLSIQRSLYIKTRYIISYYC